MLLVMPSYADVVEAHQGVTPKGPVPSAPLVSSTLGTDTAELSTWKDVGRPGDARRPAIAFTHGRPSSRTHVRGRSYVILIAIPIPDVNYMSIQRLQRLRWSAFSRCVRKPHGSSK